MYKLIVCDFSVAHIMVLPFSINQSISVIARDMVAPSIRAGGSCINRMCVVVIAE